MKTNFFECLAGLKLEGAFQLQITRGPDEGMVVSVFLKNDKADDPARKVIPPAVLSGSPEELDAGFFESIMTPLQKTSELFLNMAEYKQQSEQAQKESKAEKEKLEKAKKDKDAAGAKFKEMMSKVDKLEKEGKHKEAVMALPKKEEFPERAEEIAWKRNSLSRHLSPLFGDVVEQPEEAKDPEETEEEEEEIEEDETEEEEEENDDDYE